MPDLVQTFRFRVRLTRSAAPGRTDLPPPVLAHVTHDAPAAAVAAAGGERGSGAAAPERLGDGGFQECAGLGLEADLREHAQGGANDAVVRRVGRVRLQPLVLKRGMLLATADGGADTGLWDWLQGMVDGGAPAVRYDGDIEVLDPTGQRVVARWTFTRGLPLKIIGPSLNAKTGEIAMEELHIAHEGLCLERTP
ncbi:phage tail protein [Streptomyces sp. NBC_00536]|uniref:phage tail protein n=1 Tax=Streptomyces sp. NBC_00536 TaxID=2975769 RepID=UPI002E8163CA|nr:phage tail protein [Streptomyces sp. NBC_00536]WUC82730.1 phage tail protein [Streptomyces sp. NBC_00536]